jgi:uncharacterized protein YjbI with pentapeptide repeats
MMFNRNQNGQASKEPNKATSVDEDVTTVDWMIMTDIGTRIGKIPKSKPESQPQSKLEAKSDFKDVTKQEPNKSSAIATPFQASSNQPADDDREDIEWLQSLDLDKPIERILSTKKTTGNNQQSATNKADGNGNNDVENIDWLIVSDLKTKKIDSGFNHNSNSSESLPIAPQNNVPRLQIAPPSEIQANIFGDSNLENDFGDLGLDELELIADDDLGDLQFDDLDEMRLNELISGIGVTDSKLQELSELMDDEFSLDDYGDSSSEHELDTILGISKVRYPNDKLGIVNDSFEISTQLPEAIVANEELDKELDNIDIISEQQYPQFEQDDAQEYFEVERFDSLEEDLNLEENLSDEVNNSEESFTSLEENLVSEFDNLAEYPVIEYPSDDLLEYPSNDLEDNDLADYPVAEYPSNDLAEYAIDNLADDDLAEYAVDDLGNNDLVDYPVAEYPSDDLSEYAIDDYSSSDLAEYPLGDLDDVAEYPVAEYSSGDLAEYPLDNLASYPVDNLGGYPYDNLAEYPTNVVNDLPENLPENLALSDEFQDEYLTENIAVTEEFQVSQDVFATDNFDSLNHNQEFASQEFRGQEFRGQEISTSELVNPLDDGFGGMRSPIVLDAASLLGDEIWNSSAIASSATANGEDFASNYNSSFEDPFVSDWNQASPHISPNINPNINQDINQDIGNDPVWNSSANVNTEVLSSTAIDNAFGSVDDWAIAPQLDLPSDLPIDLSYDLSIDLIPEEHFFRELQENIEVPPKSTVKSPFTEQEYLELQEYDRIFAAAESTPEPTSESIPELAIASNSSLGIAVKIDQENTQLQSEIDSEIDDLDWNPESEAQLLADMGHDDYAEWNDKLKSEDILESNDQDLDWNAQAKRSQSESDLVGELELADYDDYVEWQSELKSEEDNDTSWQDGLDGLINSDQYLDNFDLISDETPLVAVSSATEPDPNHGDLNQSNDDLLAPDNLESSIDSHLSSDWDEFEQPLSHQISHPTVGSDFDDDFGDGFSDYQPTSLLDSPSNNHISNDWKPNENEPTVVDELDEMESIIDENFDLVAFDEDQFPEVPLTNSNSVNVATTLTPNRATPIPPVVIPNISKPDISKPKFTDLPAPAIAAKDTAKDELSLSSEDMLLEEAFTNDLLNQNYDLEIDPFEEALASDLLNGYTARSSGFNQLDDFVPASETLPPPNPTPPSNFVMASSNNDFLDDFDFDSIEIQDFSGKNNSKFPAISTGLTPPSPASEPIAKPEPPINNSFLTPPALPPLPPKRNTSQGRPASSTTQNRPIQPQNIQPTRDYLDSLDEDSNFDGFHIQAHQDKSQNRGLNQTQNQGQNSARKSINSIDESWSDLLNADTVISGVLHSPPSNMNLNVSTNVSTPQGLGSGGRNSQGRDGRDQASARNSFQRQPSNLPDFTALGLEIHDDNTDWSGLLDSDEANDSITSISNQMSPLPRAQVDISAFNTSITGSSATREIPRDRRQPVANYGDANQVRMGTTPDQMSFNRFTEDNYNSYGSGQGVTTQNQNKPQFKTSTLSLESLWQSYLKIPVMGLGAIGAAFLLYTIANKPIFDLGLRWGIFKDASGRDFKDADFRGVKLDNVNFSNAILTSAKMQDASLSGANFYEANLNGVNFTNANLRGARLIRASVVWSEFKNTQMSLADLAEADLTRSNFATAKMEGANLKDSKIGAQGTESATIFTPTNLLAWQIVNEPKSNRNLANQNLAGLNLSFTSLKKANLSNTNLNFVDMTNTDLSGANLTGSQVNGTNWSGANLAAINLSNVVFDKSKLPKTNETTTCPNGKKGPCKFL